MYNLTRQKLFVVSASIQNGFIWIERLDRTDLGLIIESGIKLMRLSCRSRRNNALCINYKN